MPGADTLPEVDEAILVPVKAFHRAKARLRGQIPDPDRVRLARWTADRVLDAVAPKPTFVACDDERVAAWASERGATVLWGPGLGLNGAIDQAVSDITASGFDHVTITHSDLPLPGALAEVAVADTIVLVPDGRDDGTNVLSRPGAAEIAAQYGSQSFRAHLEAALASGYPVKIERSETLALDIDDIDDIRNPLVSDELRSLLGHTGIGEP